MADEPAPPQQQEVLRAVSARDMRLAIGCTPAPVEQIEAWEAYEKSQGKQS